MSVPLKHSDIWRAIDRLAQRNGMSPSGLACKAGLSSTIFNPSKRVSADRKRWPSTESIALILQATGTGLEEFVGLASAEGTSPRASLPLINQAQAGRDGNFDESGKPSGRGWEEIRFPKLADPHAFAIEIAAKSMEPVYREGDRIVISPAEKPRRGDRVVLRTAKGEIVIGQLGREGTHKIELLSLIPNGPVTSLSPHEIDWVYRIVWVSQ